MKNYLDLLQHVLKHGESRDDRTGTGTLGIFGHQLRFDLREGFPLVTTKKCHLRSIIHELLWFLKGDTNIKYLNENKVTIWDEWADETGDLGPIYGYQWRHWGKDSQETKGATGIDQITQLIEGLKNAPHSRRHIVNSWNVSDLDKLSQAPPFCHTMFQMYVHNDGRLSCHLYQRSADLFLGVPFNIASYALLTMMIAQVTGYTPGDFVHSFGDAHIYKNHIDQVKLQLTREPKSRPKMLLNPDVKNIFDFKFEDFQLTEYDPHPTIRGEISI